MFSKTSGKWKWPVAVCASTGNAYAGTACIPDLCFSSGRGLLPYTQPEALLQMFLFALISELPFDLAAANRWFYPGYQNVFFEFLIGLAVLWGMEQAQFREKTPLAVEAGKIFAVALGCMAAVLIQSDYDYIGIIIIAAFYEFHYSRAGRSVAAAVLGGLETLDLNYGVGALAAIPIWFYNGKRGKQKFKYVFYWFYPVHLTVLVLIRAGFLGIFPW